MEKSIAMPICDQLQYVFHIPLKCVIEQCGKQMIRELKLKDVSKDKLTHFENTERSFY